MGGWSVRLGDYEASQMDYYYQGIEEEGKTLRYFQNEKVDVKFKNLVTRKEKIVSVPLSELHDFKKIEDSELYYLADKDRGLWRWLWSKIKSFNVEVKSAFSLKLNISREYFETCPTYYLNSEVFDEDIKVSTIPKEITINSLDELDWLSQRGFYYSN